MCGIIVVDKDGKQNLKKYFQEISHRGEDSFGGIMEVGENNELRKSLYRKQFLKQISDINFSWGVFHNRKASIGGAKELGLAHPIWDKNSAVIHNGTKRKLYDAFSSLGNSDTAVIHQFLENIEWTAQTEKLLQATLKGAGVVFNKNPNKGLFFHRDEGRPFFVNEERTLGASEPLNESDTWFLVKPQDTWFTDIEDFMENVETFGKGVKKDRYAPRYCGSCKKTHYHIDGDEDICCECHALGKTAPTTTYWGNNTKNDKIPNGVLVDFFYMQWYSSGVVVDFKEDTYLVKTNYGEFPIPKDDVMVIDPSTLPTKGFTYWVSDNELLGKECAEHPKWNNKKKTIYPYSVKTKGNYSQMWKYLRVKPEDVESLLKEIS